jgi:hypothetical protein
MWPRIVNIIIGLSLMLIPTGLRFEKTAADNNHITGPVVITFAIISLWEINRNVRWLNLATGWWLILSPFILDLSPSATKIDVSAGIVIAILSLYKGNIKNRYGGGWRSLFQKYPLHMEAVEPPDFKPADRESLPV